MKKYYWLKLHKDFFKRHDVSIIEDMPNGKDYILFYLKLLVESVSHEGNLRFSDSIPYNEQMLSSLTKTNIDIVRSAVKIFSELNMMEMLDDGTIYMTEVDKMIGAETDAHIREQTRLRVAKYRERQKTLRNATVTLNGNGEIRDKSIEILDKKETISKDIVKKKNATNVATLTKRKDEFYQSLIPFLDKYQKEMVRDFFEYWSEPNKAKTKMRFELEKTWDTSRRLATWAKRDNNFNSNGQRFNTTSNYESATDRKRREQQEYANRLANELQQKYGS